MSTELLRVFDVFMWENRPAIVLAPSMDKTSRTRKFSDRCIDCAYVESDGSLGDSFEIDRIAVLDTGKLQLIDGAEAEIRVKLPEDVVTQIKEYNARKDSTVTKQQYDLYSAEEDHASYGCIQLHRYSGQTGLFMSPFVHHNFIGISISRAKKLRSHSRDYAWGGLRKIIEVYLSETQFASFITSAGQGNGTPCTIHNVINTIMPDPPGNTEIENLHEDIQKSVELSVAELNRALEFMEGLINQSTVSKKDRKTLRDYIFTAQKQLTDSTPFIVTQMRKRMEDVVSEARAEIEAYMNDTIRRAGLTSLGSQETPIRMLTGEVKKTNDT